MKVNIYKLDDIDCIACSLKLEESIKKLDGVIECSMNYFGLKLIVKFDENILSDQIIENTIYSSLNDVTILEKNGVDYEYEEFDTKDSIKRRLFFRKRR